VTVEDNRASGWGVGINLSQTTNSRISENTTDNNETGIQVMESAGNTFRHNAAHHNQVVDLTWDGLNSQHFSKNSCGTALPSKAMWDCR
jgi:parallel beta-helix repeat protein